MNNLFLEEEIKLKEEAVRVFCNISKVITYSFEEKEIMMGCRRRNGEKEVALIVPWGGRDVK